MTRRATCVQTVIVNGQTDFIPEWTLGWRLRRALAHAGLTNREMAAELGVHRDAIRRWCGDYSKQPSRAYLLVWAQLCGVSLDWLQNGTDNSSNHDKSGKTAA